MRKGILVLALSFAVTWSVLLFPWIEVQGQGLTGADLNQLLVTLPGIAILISLIALYGKLTRFLVLIAGVTMLVAAAFALVNDFIQAPASLLLQESLTGIAGESSLGIETLWPIVFSIMAIGSALASLIVARLPFEQSSAVDEPRDNDARTLWDDQTNH
jgi:phosphoglycerol transferase MdoB-like AlkP superfamily enzyme